MAAQIDKMDSDAMLAAVQGMAVECVTYDRADRPKRRRLLPLVVLLAPFAGGATGLRDAG